MCATQGGGGGRGGVCTCGPAQYTHSEDCSRIVDQPNLPPPPSSLNLRGARVGYGSDSAIPTCGCMHLKSEDDRSAAEERKDVGTATRAVPEHPSPKIFALTVGTRTDDRNDVLEHHWRQQPPPRPPPPAQPTCAGAGANIGTPNPLPAARGESKCPSPTSDSRRTASCRPHRQRESKQTLLLYCSESNGFADVTARAFATAFATAAPAGTCW